MKWTCSGCGKTYREGDPVYICPNIDGHCRPPARTAEDAVDEAWERNR